MDWTQPRIDHVGIAVHDLEAAAAHYSRLLGLPPAYRERVASDGVDAVVFALGASRVELLTPFVEGSPVDRFLKKRGEALHHLAFGVVDVRAAMVQAAAAGAQVIDAEPRVGSGGKLVAFLHPKSAHGVLTELVQIDAS